MSILPTWRRIGSRAIVGGIDEFLANVVMLLHMDGDNGSPVFTNSSPYSGIVNRFGDTRISTAISRFGSASGFFDGTGDYLTAPTNALFDFGTTDFTIECWAYFTSFSSFPNLFSQRDNSSGLTLRVNNTGRLNFFHGNGNGSLTGSTVISLNTWNHVALTRQNNFASLWLNGALEASGGNYPSFSSTQPLNIGRSPLFEEHFSGYMDEVRVTYGVSRYNSPFTPLTAPFPDIGPLDRDVLFSRVVLLLAMNGSEGSTVFTDSSSSARAVTVAGTTRISTAQSRFGGASAFFDGNGSNLRLTPSTDLQFPFPSDFTIELWVYPTTTQDDIILSTSVDSNVQIFRINQGGTVGRLSCFLNTSQVFDVANAGVTANQWQHLAMCRSGTSTRLFVNGVQVGTTNTTYTGSFRMDVIGNFFLSGGAQTNNQFAGYIDELRVTRAARYVSNFVPQATAFANS